MSLIYTTSCSLCTREFRSRKALQKHFESRHPGHELGRTIMFTSDEKQARVPVPKSLKGRSGYLEWLANVVEGMNSAHNPNAPGMKM